MPTKKQLGAPPTGPVLFTIEVPKDQRKTFWTRPKGNLEYWAFKNRPRAFYNEKIVFTFGGKPVAEAIVLKVEGPGKGEGEYKHWHKVYWHPTKFRRYKASKMAAQWIGPVYHGTIEPFGGKLRGDRNSGNLIWFTDDPDYANAFATFGPNYSEHSRVYPSYIKFNKPFDARQFSKEELTFSEYCAALNTTTEEMISWGVHGAPPQTYFWRFLLITGYATKNVLRKQGYDGIIQLEARSLGETPNVTSFIVFSSTQVRSATGEKRPKKLLNLQTGEKEGSKTADKVLDVGDGEEYWAGEGNAASGILPVCPQKGTVCLAMRSEYVMTGNCWGTIGGAVQQGMSPQQSAKAELREETGYAGTITLIPAFTFTDRSFSYHNFIGVTPTEFTFSPKPYSKAEVARMIQEGYPDYQLNPGWETTHIVWVPYEQFVEEMTANPSDFHPGVLKLYQNSKDKIEKALKIQPKKAAAQIEKLKPEDFDEAIAVAEASFPNYAGQVRGIVEDALGGDLSHSFVAKDNGKIIGGYLLAENQLPKTIPDPKTTQFYGKKGVEGVALFVLPEYRGGGVGRQLRALPLSQGYDYIWGQHLEDLNNLQNWVNFGRKHLLTYEEHGTKVHVTVMDLKPTKQAAKPRAEKSFLWAMYNGDFKVLWVKTIMSKLHVNWFEEMGWPSVGDAFDRIPRGTGRVEPNGTVQAFSTIRGMDEEEKAMIGSELMRQFPQNPIWLGTTKIAGRMDFWTKVALNVPRLVKDFGKKLVQRWVTDPWNTRAHRAPEMEKPTTQNTDPENLINWIANQDPTPNKEYTAWIVGNYTRGDIARWEDIVPRVIPALKRFHALKIGRRIPNEERDIGRIKGLQALEALISKYEAVDATSNRQMDAMQEQKYFKDGSAELVLNNDQFKIVIPKTQETSCYFGVNTKWCTAAQNGNMFARYAEDGPLYIVLIKANNERYQFHFESGQFMDEKDHQINPSIFFDKYPALAQIFYPIAQEVVDNGQHHCESCNGVGLFKCEKCDGTKYEWCPDCSGAQEYQCSECEGNGTKEEPNDDGDMETVDCTVCNGDGVLPCEMCGGSGKVECGQCNGVGEWDCEDCSGTGENQQTEHFRDEAYSHIPKQNAMAQNASWMKSAAGFVFKSFPKVWHVGTMNVQDKRDDSYEGAGLSVSVHPDEWRGIAGVGGDLWELTKPKNKFVNFHRLTKAQRKSISDWGIKNGYAQPAELWRHSYFDDESGDEGEWRYSEYTSKADAEAELGSYGEEKVEPVVGGLVATPKLSQKSLRGNIDPTEVLDLLVTAYAEDELDCDGVWWADTLDPEALSAPRGVIFPTKLKSWKVKKLADPIRSASKQASDLEYYMREGCGIFAVALCQFHPKGDIKVISDVQGDEWNEAVPYEMSHVYCSAPEGNYDVKGARSVEQMASDLGIGQYRVLGGWSAQEFLREYMGMGDVPLYGDANDVEEAKQIIEANPEKYGLPAKKTAAVEGLQIPAGTKLYRGIGEDVIDSHAPAADGCLWTTQSITIARSYIPASGLSLITTLRRLCEPADERSGMKDIQKQLGFEYTDVKYETNGRPNSFRYPAIMDKLVPEPYPNEKDFTDRNQYYDATYAWTEKRQKALQNYVKQKLAELGYQLEKPNDYDGGRLDLMVDMKDGKDVLLPNKFQDGTVCVFVVEQPLNIFDMTEGGKNEGDLLDPQYREYGKFEALAKSGYDGVKINDYAQIEGHGNFGHTSIGLFAQGIPKVKEAERVQATHPEDLYADLKKFGAMAGDTAVFNGKKIWSGAINVMDGVIEETHTYQEAEDAGWHHSFYFSPEAQDYMRAGEWAFFCVYDTGEVLVNATGRNDLTKEQEAQLGQRVREQVQIKPLRKKSAKKPSPTQLIVLQGMAKGGGVVARRPGGFWVWETPEGEDHNGVPYFADEKKVPVDWNASGFYIERPYESKRWVDIRTLRAMENQGWLERTNQYPEEWKDPRKLTDVGRAVISQSMITASSKDEVVEINGIPANERHEYVTPAFTEGMTVLQGIDLPLEKVEFKQKNIKVEDGGSIGIAGPGADSRDLSYVVR